MELFHLPREVLPKPNSQNFWFVVHANFSILHIDKPSRAIPFSAQLVITSFSRLSQRCLHICASRLPGPVKRFFTPFCAEQKVCLARMAEKNDKKV